MITIFGTSLSATSPLLLLAIPAAASILIYTFRARGSGSPTVTSSLFLLSKLPLYLPARKSFLPPAQFWIELLAFLLLSIAAAGLTASRVGQRIAVVIDTSTSMSARTSSDATKLDQAKRLARADIAQASSTSRFAIFSADSELRSVSAGAVSGWRAGDSLQAITPAHAADNLADTLSSLLGDPRFDSVWVYTDKKNGAVSEPSGLRVTTIPLDRALTHNIWIHSASLALVGGEPTLRVEIASSDDRPARPVVSATCASEAPETSFTLPGVTATVTRGHSATLLLGPLKPQWNFCTVTLSGDAQLPADAIQLDNSAYVVNNTESSVVLVASSLAPTALGLTQLSDYSFEPESKQAPAGSARSIFHRTTPKNRPSFSSLVIFPPEGALPWRGGSVSAAPTGGVEISRWLETHPLMRYTQPHLLSIPSARVLVCPDSAIAVIYSPLGPLVCAGEEAGARYIIVGFELLPFDGIQSPTLSVLTLNALRWLFQDLSPHGGTHELSARLLTSDAQVTQLAPKRGAVSSNERLELLRAPGVFTLSATSGAATKNGLVAINSLSDEESDLSQDRLLIISSMPRRAATDESDELHLHGYLAALGLLILCIDLALRLRRRAQWGAV